MALRLSASMIVLAISLFANANAFGNLIIASVVGGGPSIYANYANFDNLALGSAGGVSGGVTVNLTPNAQVVVGSASGLYAAPFISNSNATLFGDNTISGPDTTRYLTSGSTGATTNAQVEMIFGAGQQYLGLLWGSVDLYNTLTFHFDDNTTQSITGAAVSAFANGNQGAAGTYYVNINANKTFYKVVATSSQYAFEFDNVAYSRSFFNVPEPGSLLVWGVLGLSVSGLSSIRRRQR